MNSFVLYTDILEPLNLLSDDEAGELFKNILEYVSSGTILNFKSRTGGMLFSVIKQKIDQNRDKYLETVEKRKIAGREGGKQKALNAMNKKANATNDVANLANAKNAIKFKQSLHDTVTVTDTVTDTDIDNNSNQRLERKNSDEFSPSARLGLKEKDYVSIQRLWNDLCFSFRKVTKLTSKSRSRSNRKSKIRECVKCLISENEDPSIDNVLNTFRIAFQKVERSQFLKGGGERGWKADFDWVMIPDNLLKILEGNYDNPDTS